MSLNNPYMHEGYVPAYQASAVPYVTSSLISLGGVQVITFPQVTRFFEIRNVSSTSTDRIAIAFTQRGLGATVGNYFTVGPSTPYSGEIRCTKLFISCSAGTNVQYQIIAGLTNIPSSQSTVITGSNGYEGVG